MWYPEGSESGHQAKKLCKRCPVIDECFDYAMTNQEKFGIWGGLSANERKKLRQLNRRILREAI